MPEYLIAFNAEWVQELTDDARRAVPDRPLTADDFAKLAGLADDDLMRQAWS